MILTFKLHPSLILLRAKNHLETLPDKPSSDQIWQNMTSKIHLSPSYATQFPPFVQPHFHKLFYYPRPQIAISMPIFKSSSFLRNHLTTSLIDESFEGWLVFEKKSLDAAIASFLPCISQDVSMLFTACSSKQSQSCEILRALPHIKSHIQLHFVVGPARL